MSGPYEEIQDEQVGLNKDGYLKPVDIAVHRQEFMYEDVEGQNSHQENARVRVYMPLFCWANLDVLFFFLGVFTMIQEVDDSGAPIPQKDPRRNFIHSLIHLKKPKAEILFVSFQSYGSQQVRSHLYQNMA